MGVLICVSVGGGVLCWLAACCHSIYLPPLPGEFQPGICQSVDPSSSTHWNCHPCHCQSQIQSICDTDFVFNIGAGGILWH
ncbi:unnamed protein product, partial [Staurois parvus]